MSVHMARVYLGIGSNIDPGKHIATALTALIALGTLTKVSPIYETEPLGPLPQSWYHNCVVELTTVLAPAALLVKIKDIEHQTGRLPQPKWSARPLDIDILLYDSLTIDTVSLHIPHLELANRRFTLQPFCDIAPDVIDPRSGKTIRQLLQECADILQIKQLHYHEPN